MKILILTDLSTHTSTNSLYGIARAIDRHEKVDSVYIASRHLEENAMFFREFKSSQVVTQKITQDFAFGKLPEKENLVDVHLSAVDFILLRLPRPIPSGFFDHLKRVFPEKRIINRPSGIEKTGSKEFLMSLSKFTPPIALCTTFEDIIEFASKFHTVLKPLVEYGGRGIVKIDGENVWRDGKEESLAEFHEYWISNPTKYLAMQYLKNVHLGDKRIVVANGEVLVAALRLPAKGGWLCNVAQGGSSTPAEVDHDELNIIRHISPILHDEGIFVYGLDTLVNNQGKRVISEINTLSVGGINPANDASDASLSDKFATLFINYCLRN